MTVFDNLAFPLRNRGWSGARLRQRVRRSRGRSSSCARDLARRARALSADQKQKISLGRGLVRPDVAAVLFDEPLTVIDPHLKWLLRRKLKQIHQQLKLSLLYVTHDQTEALTFADQVVVMSQGEIVQVGTPRAAVRDAGASLRRTLHRLARHELPRLRVERRRGRRSPACASRRAARRRRRPARRCDRRAARIPGARSGAGTESRAGARRSDSGPGHPHDGATGSRRSRSPGRSCAAGERRCRRQRFRLLCRPHAARSTQTSGECRELVRKPVNQRAWWFVLPVLISVAFSALIPLMTIVNYSVQDILGPDQAVFVGMEWYQEILRDPELHGALVSPADLHRPRCSRSRFRSASRSRWRSPSAAGALRSCWSCSRCPC